MIFMFVLCKRVCVSLIVDTSRKEYFWKVSFFECKLLQLNSAATISKTKRRYVTLNPVSMLFNIEEFKLWHSSKSIQVFGNFPHYLLLKRVNSQTENKRVTLQILVKQLFLSSLIESFYIENEGISLKLFQPAFSKIF